MNTLVEGFLPPERFTFAVAKLLDHLFLGCDSAGKAF